MWQQTIDPSYYEKPLEDRYELAVALSLNGEDNEPTVVRRALALGPLPSISGYIEKSLHCRLLGAIAGELGTACVFHENPNGMMSIVARGVVQILNIYIIRVATFVDRIICYRSRYPFH